MCEGGETGITLLSLCVCIVPICFKPNFHLLRHCSDRNVIGLHNCSKQCIHNKGGNVLRSAQQVLGLGGLGQILPFWSRGWEVELYCCSLENRGSVFLCNAMHICTHTHILNTSEHSPTCCIWLSGRRRLAILTRST